MGKMIGIDLGSGYSCVSILEGWDPKIIVSSLAKPKASETLAKELSRRD